MTDQRRPHHALARRLVVTLSFALLSVGRLSAQSDPARSTTNGQEMRCYAATRGHDAVPRAIIVPIAHFAPFSMSTGLLARWQAALQSPARIVFESGGGPSNTQTPGTALVSDLDSELRRSLTSALSKAVGEDAQVEAVADRLPLSWLISVASSKCSASLQQAGLKRLEPGIAAWAASQGWPIDYLETQQEFDVSADAISPASQARLVLSQLKQCASVGALSTSTWRLLHKGSPLALVNSRARAELARRGTDLSAEPSVHSRDVRLRERLQALIRDGQPGAIVFIGVDHLSPMLDQGSPSTIAGCRRIDSTIGFSSR